MVENKFTITIVQLSSISNKINANNKIQEAKLSKWLELQINQNLNTSFSKFSLKIINQFENALYLTTFYFLFKNPKFSILLKYQEINNRIRSYF